MFVLTIAHATPITTIPRNQQTNKQVASTRREFPIFELANNVKYEFLPSITLQYKGFQWQVRTYVYVMLVGVIILYVCLYTYIISIYMYA